MSLPIENSGLTPKTSSNLKSFLALKIPYTPPGIILETGVTLLPIKGKFSKLPSREKAFEYLFTSKIPNPKMLEASPLNSP